MRKLYILVALLIAQITWGQSIDTVLINKKLTVQEMRADLDTLYYWLTESHPDLYRMVSKKQADAKWAAVIKSITKPMNRRQFLSIASPLLAQYQDGHTGFWAEFDMPEFLLLEKENGTLFPLSVAMLNNRAFVQSSEVPGILPGDEIVRINDKPMQQIIHDILPSLSGDSKLYSLSTLSRLFGFIVWLNYDWKNKFVIEVRNNKKVTTVQTNGISVQEYMDKLFVGIPNRRLLMYPQYKLAVLEFNRYNQYDKAIAFIDSAFSEIKAHGIEHVVLDLRKNGGGNSSIGDYVLAHVTRQSINATASKAIKDGPIINRQKPGSWSYKLLTRAKSEWKPIGNNMYRNNYGTLLPDSIKNPANAFSGQFYLFTSPTTYSSAHMTALAVKCNKLGTIIGEPTGERINLTGEVMTLQLPNSKLYPSIPAAIYEGACGDTNKVGVQPDVIISLKEKDLITNNDPVLQYLFDRQKSAAKK